MRNLIVTLTENDLERIMRDDVCNDSEETECCGICEQLCDVDDRIDALQRDVDKLLKRVDALQKRLLSEEQKTDDDAYIFKWFFVPRDGVANLGTMRLDRAIQNAFASNDEKLMADIHTACREYNEMLERIAIREGESVLISTPYCLFRFHSKKTEDEGPVTYIDLLEEHD